MATDITAMKRKYRERNEGEYPDELTIKLQKETDQKYGTNPNQTCAIYKIISINDKETYLTPCLTSLQSVRNDDQGKGGLSLNNLEDITRGMEALKFFERPTAIIMKHVIASGFATQTGTENLTQLFGYARDTDRQSNFGGTFISNQPLDQTTAEAMYELRGTSPFFIDVVAAPSYEEGVVGYLQQQSKNLRIAQFFNLGILPKFVGDETRNLKELRGMPTGRIGIQDVYLSSIKSIEDFIVDPAVTHKDHTYAIETLPTPQQLDDLLTAWRLNVGAVRSNGIVIVKNGRSIAIGAGQVERYGALAQAITKGMQKRMDILKLPYDPLSGAQTAIEYIDAERMDNPFEGAVLSSDAFFPFRDSIDLAARVGITAIAQPYGSERDYEVIQAANEHRIAMVATLERCFLH